jgi:hypothetical protein
VAAVLFADAVKRFPVTAPQPPGHDWQRRLTLLVIAFVGGAGLLLTFHGGGSTRRVAQRATPSTVAPPSSAAPATTTTTVDPKAISAAVASLVAHEGPSPQEVAAAPASTRSTAGARHSKSGGSHIRK